MTSAKHATNWQIKMKPSGSAAGFSLVELMVAMVIGLLGIIVMMQMFSVFEEQKRTTTGGDDAISSGSIALNSITRDIQQSGWGIAHLHVVGCSVTGLVSGGAAIPLVPVTINPVGITGDANTDTLLVIYGNGNGTVEGDLIDAQPSANVYAVKAAESYTPGDIVVAMPQARPATCTLARTTVALNGISRPNVTVAAGVASMAGGRLYNLGTAPVVRAYAVRGGALSVCDYTTTNCASNGATWTQIASNVVSMRAQYGRDTAGAAMDGIADTWDQVMPTTATPISSNGTKNTQACGVMRVSALRLAIVARSSQPEKRLDGTITGTDFVTPTDRAWAGSDAVAIAANAANAAAVALVLPNPSGTWPTWQDFRYKIFQTTVPLRNITSLGVSSEC